MKTKVLYAVLFVFLGVTAAHGQGVRYVGCFNNDVLKWAGTASVWDKKGLQYPEYGVNLCKGKGYDYTGWQGHQIFCGNNSDESALVNAAECNFACVGCEPAYENDCSSGRGCGGGAEILSVYTRAGQGPPDPPQQTYVWTVVPGQAHDIGVDASGIPWIIGTKKVPGGYEIFRWNGSGWTNAGGGATRIALGADGMPWIVNEYGAIYRWTGSAWQQIQGQARDIAVAQDGSIWVIGSDKTRGGYHIYKWTGSDWEGWGGAINIALEPDGTPWVVNESNDIYRFVNRAWEKLPGKGWDIGVGPGGVAWLIGTKQSTGGFEIFRWTGRNWSAVPGGAMRVAVGGNGTPWVVNNQGSIFWGARPQ